MDVAAGGGSVPAGSVVGGSAAEEEQSDRPISLWRLTVLLFDGLRSLVGGSITLEIGDSRITSLETLFM